MATRHSRTVGGSSAGRLLNCPASLKEIMNLPQAIETTSEYAEEGTHLHDVSAMLMTTRMRQPKADLKKLAALHVGKVFHDRPFTRDLLDSCIEPALDHLAELERLYGGGFKVVGVETEVRFPGIPDGFGTADIFLQSRRYLLMPDWKFGAGVPVLAVYTEDAADGTRFELVNPQLLYYITAAFATPATRPLFEGREIVGAIIQPRADDPMTHTKITVQDMHYFAEDLENAFIRGFDPHPHREKGEWCRFAPCKLTCPFWTNFVLDLSMLEPVQRPKQVARIVTPYGDYLSRAKALIDLLMIFKSEIDNQMHVYLEDGGLVPGWKLKLKRTNRQWSEISIVAEALKKLGFKREEIVQEKLVTFASADATAKRLGVVIPDHLRVAPMTTETTVAADDDPAPAVDRVQAAEDVRAALKKLQESGS